MGTTEQLWFVLIRSATDVRSLALPDVVDHATEARIEYLMSNRWSAVGYVRKGAKPSYMALRLGPDGNCTQQILAALLQLDSN